MMVWTLILTAIVLSVAAAVMLPFLRPGEPWETPNKETELDRLLAEKQRTMRTLKDLDQERLAGLMSETDHDEARAEYMERAVDLNRQIASLTGVDPTRMTDAVAS
jgi:hypothetical protein